MGLFEFFDNQDSWKTRWWKKNFPDKKDRLIAFYIQITFLLLAIAFGIIKSYLG